MNEVDLKGEIVRLTDLSDNVVHDDDDEDNNDKPKVNNTGIL